MIKRRNIEVFSLSFLDCLCCGFGAILLIFLLSIGSGRNGGSSVDSQALDTLREQLAQLEADIADKAARLDAATNSEQTSIQRQKLLSLIQELESTLADLQQDYDARVANLSTQQAAQAEANRLLQSFEYEDLPPIGLPSDATHVAFVIDTSGSMRNQYTHRLHTGIVNQITQLLDSLPKVERIQFLDTSGNYILPNRTWFPDTPSVRRDAQQRILNYPIFSVSNPAPGIQRVFKELARTVKPEDHMSVYVVGDDFGGNTTSFLVQLDRLNPRDPQTGKRAASINAIGFPTIASPFQIGGLQGNTRFANLMREIAEAHNGVLILKPSI
ncbi:vWA domain-containing protein [Coraliomargarita akajimensis]|uniref:von Willebrand factor type A n=1 Tax=Coraliomargarita akajimensis (strain DSM 45221 / IAM 15411 / JCM 23193 / KCTC 12865 / 04OKA010-24) TaxID=583355 RepID=D5EP18_CORAD|nr:vWA domain-containing protein [Coraliomargarita akajimensis]ADE55528.1 hypothetical protein Caka_2512 [Coraliomargarita akajimensis DSM 45221]